MMSMVNERRIIATLLERHKVRELELIEHKKKKQNLCGFCPVLPSSLLKGSLSQTQEPVLPFRKPGAEEP